MQMQAVESSQISHVGYDEKTKVLCLRFVKGGAYYTYKGIPIEVHKELLESESIGSYFGKNIRMKYQYEKLTFANRPPDFEIEFV